MTLNPFDPDRDHELGAALREILQAADAEAFAARVMAALRSETAIDVLSDWWRPSVAAVLALLAGAGLWAVLQGQPAQATTVADIVRPGDAPAELFSPNRPDQETILQVVLER
ncbi:MAG: hypothetical protein AB7I33_03320 [Gemmatimonadales bacterium]